MGQERLVLKSWQKRVLIGGGLLFGLAVFSISLYKQSTRQVDSIIGSVGLEPTPAVLMPIISSTYPFPQPGMLPDQPLYLFMMMRDQVEKWLARDLPNRIDLDIEHANIRLMAGKTLLEKGEVELSVDSLIKAERYLREATDLLKEKPGDSDPRLLMKVLEAAQAHEQVLTSLKEMMPEDAKRMLLRAIDENQRVREEIRGIAGLDG